MNAMPVFPATVLLACAAMLYGGAAAGQPAAMEGAAPRVDLLSLARGAVPVGVDGAPQGLGTGFSQALQAIDGNGGIFNVTPKPGGEGATVVFVYALPAVTRFDAFAVPNVLETPSPSQTFFRTVAIAGSDQGRDGPFHELAAATLQTHKKKGESTPIPASAVRPVRWVRVTLAGGIKVEREKTFFEFSEIVGHGVQEPVPLSRAFSGKWKGRGMNLELAQDGIRVSGCYDGEGDLNGTVSGNLLHATGRSRKSGVPSAFVLTVGPEKQLVGVSSTNGAPFRPYGGEAAPALKTECSGKTATPIGCGSVVHGIGFDFDSAAIRPESAAHLDALYQGLKATAATAVTIIGHTSSEGADAYNDTLSLRRAEAVAAAVVARGIEAGRVSAEGRGERQPIADNASEVGRSLNRRVEIACR